MSAAIRIDRESTRLRALAYIANLSTNAEGKTLAGVLLLALERLEELDVVAPWLDAYNEALAEGLPQADARDHADQRLRFHINNN